MCLNLQHLSISICLSEHSRLSLSQGLSSFEYSQILYCKIWICECRRVVRDEICTGARTSCWRTKYSTCPISAESEVSGYSGGSTWHRKWFYATRSEMGYSHWFRWSQNQAYVRKVVRWSTVGHPAVVGFPSRMSCGILDLGNDHTRIPSARQSIA